MPGKIDPPSRGSSRPDKAGREPSMDVESFVKQVAATPSVRRPQELGRLIFAMDATASREPTWDVACDIQAAMFSETAHLGGLQVQLAFYRGFREFEASNWYHDAHALLSRMTAVRCRAGRTQIRRVLKHTLGEARRGRINALIFIGDCMEEDPDALGEMAGQLGLLGVPCFLFHEGNDARARRTFEDIAKLSGGACCRFDVNSPQQLRDLLSAVAVYAAGGRPALQKFATQQGGAIKRLTAQMDSGGRRAATHGKRSDES